MASPGTSFVPSALRRWLSGFRPQRAPSTPFEMGVAALEAGRPVVALERFEQALATASGTSERAAALNKRGVAYVALGRRPEALADFQAALDAGGPAAPALVNIGNLLLEDGHTEDALDYYRAALRADDQYAVAYRNLGVACKRLGRHAESVRALRRAGRLEMGRARVGRA